MSREANPNAESEDALAGDLGVSSGRTGPFQGIEGTGTKGSAVGHTDGELDTERVHPDDPAEGPDAPGHSPE